LISSLGNGEIENGNIYYNAFLIFLAYLYFTWHWIKGRQTLGMRSRNILLINESSTFLNWKQASLRYIASLLSFVLIGLGFVLALVDKEKRALHDRLSKTKLIVHKSFE
jgi:uncharacterized RDD family membrane protein YckC